MTSSIFTLLNKNFNSTSSSIRLFKAEMSKIRFLAAIKDWKNPILICNCGSCVSHGRNKEVSLRRMKPLKSILKILKMNVEIWFLIVYLCMWRLFSSRHWKRKSRENFGQNCTPWKVEEEGNGWECLKWRRKVCFKRSRASHVIVNGYFWRSNSQNR